MRVGDVSVYTVTVVVVVVVGVIARIVVRMPMTGLVFTMRLKLRVMVVHSDLASRQSRIERAH